MSNNISTDENNEISSLPTRGISFALAGEIFQIFEIMREEFDVDANDFMILCYLVAQSLRPLDESEDKRQNYSFETAALNASMRSGVPLTDICQRLGLSRETARRRVNRLIKLGIIIKSGWDYKFPPQVGDQDLTAKIRVAALRSALRLNAFLEINDEDS